MNRSFVYVLISSLYLHNEKFKILKKKIILKELMANEISENWNRDNFDKFDLHLHVCDQDHYAFNDHYSRVFAVTINQIWRNSIDFESRDSFST